MMRRDAVIVDLDGTLALLNGRDPFAYDGCWADLPNAPVIWLSNYLSAEVDPLLVSGREESCRALTAAWLEAHGVWYAKLFMRPVGDYRQDAVLKEEIYRRDIAPRYRVRLVLDDRDQVVAMWRGLGLTCLQVAPGAF